MKWLMVVFVLLLSGCAGNKIIDVDRDVEKEKVMNDMFTDGVEYDGVNRILVDSDDIIVKAVKADVIVNEYERFKKYEVKQDVWNIEVSNYSGNDVCVTLLWKLMDFQFVTTLPSSFLVLADATTLIGEMTEQVWEIQGVKFTPGGSGYVYQMDIDDPIEDADAGDECLNLVDEEDIKELSPDPLEPPS